MAGKQAAKVTGQAQADAKTAAQADAGAAVVALPADCRIGAQAALKAQLAGALERSAIVLDGQQVERVDTAALQLLVLLRRELDERGGTLAWRGASDALNEAAGLLGLARILELPAARPA